MDGWAEAAGNWVGARLGHGGVAACVCVCVCVRVHVFTIS